MKIGGNSSVQRAVRFIRQVFQEGQSRCVLECDEDTAIASALLLQEIAEGRDADFAKVLLEQVFRGRMRAELLAEEDIDEARAVDATPYANHIGDFLFHFVT